MTILKGRGRVATKININFFVRNEVLNIFYITIFPKKTNIFQNNRKNNFWVHDHFSGNAVSDDKNEYNFFYEKWCTEYGFEIFSSKTPILAEWKRKNQFWGHIFCNISGSIGLMVSKKKRKKKGLPMCGFAATLWISWKSVQNYHLYRGSNNYYKLKI